MAQRERPMSWDDWKWLHRWPRLTSTEWALEWLVYWCKGLAIFEVLEFAGRASVLIALIVWISEAGDREKQKHYRAWELINSARKSTGDGGRRDALQDLHEDGIDLSAAPLADAYLRKVQLPNAALTGANLSGASLENADLRKADLRSAKLSGAHLNETYLDEADLRWSDLRGAYLIKANLSGTRLDEADLRGADLSKANLSKTHLDRANLHWANLSDTLLDGTDLYQANLSEANLDGADLANIRNLDNATFCKTIMPDGTVNNRDCPPEPTPPKPNEPSPDPN